MSNLPRRTFLQSAAALTVGTPLVSACGGGGGQGATVLPPVTSAGAATTPPASTAGTSTGGTTAPSTDATSPRMPEPPQQPALALPLAWPSSSGGLQLQLLSPYTHRSAPWAVGMAFRRGEVPAGMVLALTGAVATSAGTSGTLSAQCLPKNRWPDGSLKFALLAGRCPLDAGMARTLSLQVTATADVRTPLGLSDLQRTQVEAAVDCGSVGRVTWSGDDWLQPWRTWASGPELSSWVYRKPVGSDAHLVAWLEVRLWASGDVEVLPWLENGYLKVANPGSRRVSVGFSLGGRLRTSLELELLHHQRTVLVQGEALSHWLYYDAQVLARQDPQYLQSTGLVPRYGAKVEPTAAVVQALPTRFLPLQPGSLAYTNDDMTGPGYQSPIGLLPEGDVLALTSPAVVATAAVQRNGFSAGRFPIHYRDETTQRPPRFSQHPTLVLADGSAFASTGSSTQGQRTPLPGGPRPPVWDVAHSPSVGYLAYLMTGRWYFMEEVQFATTTNYLGNGDSALLRSGSLGLVKPQPGAWQTRACAWDWRTRVQALTVTPDDDSVLRDEFRASVEANIADFHSRYIARSHNPWGWVQPGETYGGDDRQLAPWQQDFVTAAFGYSLALDLPLSARAAEQLAAFFAWKARSVVMRLGDASGFWYINAVPYTLAMGPNVPNWTTGSGPWFGTAAQVYAATYANPPSWMGRTEGQLAGEILPGETALWGNLLPALAYAVRFRVPGAAEAQQRLLGARNWPSLREALNQRPVWAVLDASADAAAVPTVPPTAAGSGWWTSAPLNAWIEIPGTAGAGGSAVFAYSGMAVDERSQEVLIAAAGGHNDSSDNRVVGLTLTDAQPRWRLRAAASATADRKPDVSHYADGTPASRHLYHTIQVVEQLNRIFLFGARTVFGRAVSFPTVDAFDLSTNRWDPAGRWAPLLAAEGNFGALKLRGSEAVVSTRLDRWSPTTGLWTRPAWQRTDDQVGITMAHDSRRNEVFCLQWGDGMGYSTQRLYASRLDLAREVQTTVPLEATAALSLLMAERPAYAGMDYDAVNDQYLFYAGTGSSAGSVYLIKPSSTGPWNVSLLRPAAGSVVLPATPPAGLHSRLRYVPALRGFVLMPDPDRNLLFLRTA